MWEWGHQRWNTTDLLPESKWLYEANQWHFGTAAWRVLLDEWGLAHHRVGLGRTRARRRRWPVNHSRLRVPWQVYRQPTPLIVASCSQNMRPTLGSHPKETDGQLQRQIRLIPKQFLGRNPNCDGQWRWIRKQLTRFCGFRRWFTWAIGITRARKAARYSASPNGGFSPPDQAILTLKPIPSSEPHCCWGNENWAKIQKKKKKKILIIMMHEENDDDDQARFTSRGLPVPGKKWPSSWRWMEMYKMWGSS